MRYEYKVEQIGGSMELIEQELNKFGAEGWQLIQIDDYKHIFMRQIVSAKRGGWSVQDDRELNVWG